MFQPKHLLLSSLREKTIASHANRCFSKLIYTWARLSSLNTIPLPVKKNNNTHLITELAVATLVASFSGKCLIYAVTERNPQNLHCPGSPSHMLCCHAAGGCMSCVPEVTSRHFDVTQVCLVCHVVTSLTLFQVPNHSQPASQAPPLEAKQSINPQQPLATLSVWPVLDCLFPS